MRSLPTVSLLESLLKLKMFGSAATLFTVAVMANVVFGAPAPDVEKRSANPSDYLNPHNAARAQTGAS